MSICCKRCSVESIKRNVVAILCFCFAIWVLVMSIKSLKKPTIHCPKNTWEIVDVPKCLDHINMKLVDKIEGPPDLVFAGIAIAICSFFVLASFIMLLCVFFLDWVPCILRCYHNVDINEPINIQPIQPIQSINQSINRPTNQQNNQLSEPLIINDDNSVV
jgi:hypothetical protein